jgi:hypothetical protein
MDLNYLYHRKQVSLMRADKAACAESKASHLGLADLYGAVIDGRRAGWQSLAGPQCAVLAL